MDILDYRLADSDTTSNAMGDFQPKFSPRGINRRYTPEKYSNFPDANSDALAAAVKAAENYQASGSKQSFTDWVKTNNFADKANAILAKAKEIADSGKGVFGSLKGLFNRGGDNGGGGTPPPPPPPPPADDKMSPVTITLIVVGSLAVVGLGIFAYKKLNK